MLTDEKKTYVGLYPNCTEIPTYTVDYHVYQFYDKWIVASEYRIKWPKYHIPVLSDRNLNKYNKFIIELDSDVCSDLNFDAALADTDQLLKEIFDKVIKLINNDKIEINEEGILYTKDGDTILDNNRYQHYKMRYLKIKTGDEEYAKYEYVHFFKLSDDYIELLDI